jgi:hypothetical protein
MAITFVDNDGALMVLREMAVALLPWEPPWCAVAAQVRLIPLPAQIPVMHLEADTPLVTWVQARILTAKKMS